MTAHLRPLTYVDLLMSTVTISIGRKEWVKHRAAELGQIWTTQPSASVSITTTGADSGTFYTFFGPIQINWKQNAVFYTHEYTHARVYTFFYTHAVFYTHEFTRFIELDIENELHLGTTSTRTLLDPAVGSTACYGKFGVF